MNNLKFYAIVILGVIVISSSSSFVFAHPHMGQILINGHTHQPQTQYIPINGIIGIEKTSLVFHYHGGLLKVRLKILLQVTP
jgi:hypothetical protein